MKVAFLTQNLSTPNFAVLSHYGVVLDAVDADLETMGPGEYQDLLDSARGFIVSFWDHPDLEEYCSHNWALGDLYRVVEHEKRIEHRIATLARKIPYIC